MGPTQTCGTTHFVSKSLLRAIPNSTTAFNVFALRGRPRDTHACQILPKLTCCANCFSSIRYHPSFCTLFSPAYSIVNPCSTTASGAHPPAFKPFTSLDYCIVRRAAQDSQHVHASPRTHNPCQGLGYNLATHTLLQHT